MISSSSILRQKIQTAFSVDVSTSDASPDLGLPLRVTDAAWLASLTTEQQAQLQELIDSVPAAVTAQEELDAAVAQYAANGIDVTINGASASLSATEAAYNFLMSDMTPMLALNAAGAPDSDETVFDKDGKPHTAPRSQIIAALLAYRAVAKPAWVNAKIAAQ